MARIGEEFVIMPGMVERADIEAFVDQVVKRFQPERVILFGSYAYGEPNEDSDVDLLVVMQHAGHEVNAATQIRLACRRHFPMDLIVRDRDTLDRRILMGDPFIKEVVAKGVTLYEADHARVG